MTSSLQKNCGKINAKPLPWFRFYTEALDDPKVQRLPPHLFKTWVNLLCLAGQNGGMIPSIDDIAFKLRMSAQDAESHVSDLILAGLIDITENGRTPHNWSARQFQSDCSTERVKKHRKIKAETPCNVSETVTETPPDTEQIQNRTDSEAETQQITLVADAPKPATKKGTRLSIDWALPEDWRQWARVTFPQSTDQGVTDLAEQFRDYWIGVPGQKGCKLDWQATWRNRCRERLSTAPLRPNAQPPPLSASAARTAAMRAILREGSAA